MVLGYCGVALQIIYLVIYIHPFIYTHAVNDHTFTYGRVSNVYYTMENY